MRPRRCSSLPLQHLSPQLQHLPVRDAHRDAGAGDFECSDLRGALEEGHGRPSHAGRRALFRIITSLKNKQRTALGCDDVAVDLLLLRAALLAESEPSLLGESKTWRHCLCRLLPRPQAPELRAAIFTAAGKDVLAREPDLRDGFSAQGQIERVSAQEPKPLAVCLGLFVLCFLFVFSPRSYDAGLSIHGNEAYLCPVRTHSKAPVSESKILTQ
jgi:hypothetical protein